LNGFIQNVKNLGPIRIAVIGGVGIALIAFVVFIIMRLGGPEMALLYGDLNAGDANRITTRLDALNVPYKLRADGAQIFVPIDQVPRTRLTLAGEGLPSGGTIGYEIFDKSQGLATSSFVQNINQVRALEGELSRTITGMENVRTARVHLVLPQRELFSRDKAEPTASILLRMNGPQRLERPQVQAIQHIVAAAVPGLKPERISIVDERGTLLARGITDPNNPGLALQSAEEMRIAYENRVARAVEALIERSLGYGKARVEVAAELDRNRTQENAESYNPEQQVVRSTQNVNDTSETTEADGNPSVTIANNLPQGAQQGGAGTTTSSRTARTEETVNYEIGRVVRNQTREPGGLSRVTVAVLVDGSYRIEDGKRVYQERSPAQLLQIEDLVKTAVGFDGRRGDEVKVVNLPFFNLDDEERAPPLLFGLNRDELMRLAEILVLGAIAALVLLLIVRPLIARLFEPEPEVATPSGTESLLGPADVPQLTGPFAGGLVPGVDMEEEYDDMIDINRIEGRVRASSIRKIGEIIDKHPEDVVAILRNWMYQEAV
jgi:flagellar M-ring protein FliF